VIQGWTRTTIKQEYGNAEKYLKELTGYTFPELLGGQSKIVLFFDEAQDSYWDDMLWIEFFKSVNRFTGPYIALFCSFGSAGPKSTSKDNKDSWQTPLSFGNDQVVGLAPRASGMGSELGLLLSFDDARDVILRALKSNPHLPAFDDELLNFLISFTDGHVGCLTAMLEIILRASIPVFHFIRPLGRR
jgi:hypothetical protein